MATEEKIGEETQLKDTTQGAKRRSAKLGTYLIPAALLVIFIVVIGFGFISRRKAEADLKQSTAAAETPEVDQQLQQARADLQTAQANLRQAEITADRWEALWKTNSVSKQETDV